MRNILLISVLAIVTAALDDAQADCLVGEDIYRLEHKKQIFDIPSTRFFAGNIPDKDGGNHAVTLYRTESGYYVVDLDHAKLTRIQKNIPLCPDMCTRETLRNTGRR